MASEELKDVQELIKLSRSPHDSGPFYHHSFWEAYKGSLKGKLGGAIIGISLGMATGALAGGLATLLIPAAVLAQAGLTAGALFLAITGGIGAAGMFYGAKEFGDSGRISGAVAAAHKDGERRMMAFEKAKFAELKQDIDDIKSAIGVKPHTATISTSKNDIDCNKVEGELEGYRRKHFSDNFPHLKKLISWKVLVIGLLAGAAIAYGFGLFGAGEAVLGALHIKLAADAAATGAAAETMVLAKTAALKTAMGITAALGLGAVGASFGINRDLFRKVFDKTDGWFKSVYNYGKRMGTELAPPAEAIDIGKYSTPAPSPVSTVIYPETQPDQPISDTFYRDKVLASAKQALLDMDHTNARAH